MSQALRITHGAFGRMALLDMDRSLVRHAHPHCHVLLKISGDDTQFTVGDQVAPLTDELAVLVNAWEPHAYVHHPARRTALILALYIEPQWLRGFRPNWMASGAPGFFQRPSEPISPRIRRLALDLVSEMVGAPDPTPRQEALLSALMIAVIERFTAWRSLDAAIGTIARLRLPPPDRRVRRVVSLMRAAPATCPGVAGLAREAGLSRAHFFRLFEQSTGVTPHVFLNVIKVEHAVRRVVDDQACLADIGAGLGFSSAAQFSHFFRDHVSVAPSAFRAVMRQSAPPDTRATT
jgi:AraC-like DNA-binding protein